MALNGQVLQTLNNQIMRYDNFKNEAPLYTFVSVYEQAYTALQCHNVTITKTITVHKVKLSPCLIKYTTP
jgi:hypothetical protein